MALAPGTRLGAYEIQSLIGSGGMGEVYRARDSRLNREVAIKVLPADVAADHDRLARFEREAQVLASLNHSNIAQIHGVDDSSGTPALIMELVEGPTLANRIANGSIPLDEALPIARQIAEALEVAHEQGIIHRDLKPANIKVRPDGTVKVLDFGLAKAFDPVASGVASATMSPTLSIHGTQAGIVLGTAAYMAPEQARGKAIDRRVDVWAFGCVLFEMLTGKRAFDGEDATAVLARIIEREPDFSLLPPPTPPAIRRLLRRSLEKDRKRRLADISDAQLEIDDASIETPVEITAASASRTTGRERVAWVLGATALLAAGALAVPATLYVRRVPPEPTVMRLDVITPPTDEAFSFALSPDGRLLTFVANGEKGAQLWVRSLDQVAARPLAGTDGASYPFWAPDSRTIGFFADGQLKRVDFAGAALQVLASAPYPRGGAWNAEGVIVFAPSIADPLMRVAATGGPATPVTRLETGQGSHRWPQFLPDGRRFLFLMATGQSGTQGIYVASLDRGEPRRVLPADTAGAFAAPGYLLLASQGMVNAYAFDPGPATVSGEPTPIAQPVGMDDGAFHSAFTVSSAGILAHRAGASRRQLVWFDRSGKRLGAIGQPDDAALANPSLAPDGRRVAVARETQGNFDVWLLDARRGVSTRFTFDAAVENAAVWSPDGSRIVFRSSRRGVFDLFEKRADGTTDEQPLLVTPQSKSPLDWSRDGRFLLYGTNDLKTGSDLWALPMTGDRRPFAVVQSVFDEIEGQFSPDGRWLAYASNESGRYQIYVRAFPEPGGKLQISVAGGVQPRWRPDGRELFFVDADGQLTAVPIHLAADKRTLEAGAPQALFATRLATGGNIAAAGAQALAQYLAMPDGRFLMNIAAEAVTSPITIVLNWQEAIRAHTPRK